jgi:hypothetical protein
VECDVDVRRLTGDKDHDVLMFKRLIPELDTSLLPTPLLAVQERVSWDTAHAVKLVCSFFLVPWIKARCYFIVLVR